MITKKLVHARSLTRKSALGGETSYQHCHQEFVGHRINDAPDDSLQFPFPSDPAVDQITDSSISEKANRPYVLIMQDEVANYWRGQ